LLECSTAWPHVPRAAASLSYDCKRSSKRAKIV
jgi:hypothetical protein